jgi:hypothetical protein
MLSLDGKSFQVAIISCNQRMNRAHTNEFPDLHPKEVPPGEVVDHNAVLRRSSNRYFSREKPRPPTQPPAIFRIIAGRRRCHKKCTALLLQDIDMFLTCMVARSYGGCNH